MLRMPRAARFGCGIHPYPARNRKRLEVGPIGPNAPGRMGLPRPRDPYLTSRKQSRCTRGAPQNCESGGSRSWVEPPRDPRLDANRKDEGNPEQF